MDIDKRPTATIHFGTHQRCSRTLTIKKSRWNVPWLNNSCLGKINTISPSHRSDKTHNAPTQTLATSRKHCTLVACFPWEINPKILAWANVQRQQHSRTCSKVLVKVAFGNSQFYHAWTSHVQNPLLSFMKQHSFPCLNFCSFLIPLYRTLQTPHPHPPKGAA